jgi:hypothetical protein
MHQRKARMAELGDAFIALPGGAGTLEEIFEQWTWAQLGVHVKPCGFLNVKGYFDPLLEMIRRMTAEQFMRPEYASMLMVETEPERLFAKFAAYHPLTREWPVEGAIALLRAIANTNFRSHHYRRERADFGGAQARYGSLYAAGRKA